MKELKWGIIFSIAMLLWLTVERLAGLHHQNIEYHFFLTNIFNRYNIFILISKIFLFMRNIIHFFYYIFSMPLTC